MGFDASNSLRYAMDQSLAIPCITGVNPYSAYIVQILNDQLDFDSNISGLIQSEARLTVADGYRSYAPGDGYLNPIITQKKGSQFTISQGQLTNNTLTLGPLVFPYVLTTYLNTFIGGTDTAVFQPALGSNSNVSIYIQIRGPSLSLNGNLFNIKQIIINDMGGLSYSLLLESNLKVAA